MRSDSGSSYDRSSRRPSFDNRDRGSSYPQYKEQFEALNIKLDKILKFLNPEKPTEETKSVEVITPVKKKTKAKKREPTEKDISAK